MEPMIRPPNLMAHYAREPLAGREGVFTISCNYCCKQYRWERRDGYGLLIRHLNSCHRDKITVTNPPPPPPPPAPPAPATP